jgi:RNA polymerase primary sigma factor
MLETDDSELLTAEQECSLALAVARGDEIARNRLVQGNARLVVRIASQYVGRGLSLEDLVGEGNLGLIRAAQEFDPRFGTRFSTYSAYWIKQSIRLALTNTSAMIRLPSHMVTLLRKWARLKRIMERDLGREATFEEIADRLELNEAYRNHVRNAFNARHLNIESNRSDEESSWRVDDFAHESPTVEASLETKEQQLWLMRRMTRLTDLERAVITLRYGLHGEESLTWCEIGRRLGVTREWARKIELKALAKLRTEPVETAPKRRTGARQVTLLRRPPESPAKKPSEAPRRPKNPHVMQALAMAGN